jgi:hypothetical protein
LYPDRCSFARNLSAVLAVGALALAPSQAVSAANWKIDPARTHIAFAIDAVGYPRTQGVFRRFNGRISVNRTYGQKQRRAPGAIAVGWRWLFIFWRLFALGGVLDAARYPTIDFVSNSVEKIDDHTARVSGDLTVHRENRIDQELWRRAPACGNPAPRSVGGSRPGRLAAVRW